MEFNVGMRININDECVGEITQVTDTQIHIRSDCFSGWANKSEILESLFTDSPNESLSHHTQLLVKSERDTRSP